jgi:hypothetical protein
MDKAGWTKLADWRAILLRWPFFVPLVAECFVVRQLTQHSESQQKETRRLGKIMVAMHHLVLKVFEEVEAIIKKYKLDTSDALQIVTIKNGKFRRIPHTWVRSTCTWPIFAEQI